MVLNNKGAISQVKLTDMKRNVFKIAHQIKGNFATWSDALKAAWKLIKIATGYEVAITYAKATGELREAIAQGIGKLDTLVKGFFRYQEIIEGEMQWRSCRLERMVF